MVLEPLDLFLLQALELEIGARQQTIEGVMQTGEELARAGHRSNNIILAQIDELQEKWSRLNEFAEARRYRLEEASQSHQVTYLIP